MSGAGISVTGLTVGYGGPPVLDHVDLHVPAGGMTAASCRHSGSTERSRS